MNGCTLNEAPLFQLILELRFAPNLKWNSYLQSKDAWKMVGSFYRSRKYLTPFVMLHFYKRQIETKMGHCYDICGLHQLNPHLSRLGNIPDCLRGLVEGWLLYSPASFFTDATSQLCSYFHEKCSDEFHSLILSVQTFTANTRHATSTDSNPRHFPQIPNVRGKFHFAFFPRTATLCNRLLHECFPEHYNINLKVNRYLVFS